MLLLFDVILFHLLPFEKGHSIIFTVLGHLHFLKYLLYCSFFIFYFSVRVVLGVLFGEGRSVDGLCLFG